MKQVYFFQFIVFFLISTNSFSQIDSVRFSNGQLIVGEIKSMDKGVLKIETDYSDSDFLIEWKKVLWLKTQTHFQITASNGIHYFSTIESLNDSIAIIIIENNYIIPFKSTNKSIDNYRFSIRIQDIVYLNAFDDRILDRFSLLIDVGLDFAKSKNLRTITTRSGLGYKADKWSTDLLFNTLQTIQDSADDIKRSDGALNFRYFLPRKWYLITSLSLLSNTEQKLDMRYNTQLGLGLFFIKTNSAYWGGKLGANRNIERYSNETEDRDSWEAYLGTEVNLYDIGDFSLNTSIMAYQGITETSRFRSDISLDLKYEFPYDLYIRFGTSINYDNRPAENASEIDYVIQTGFGWEW